MNVELNIQQETTTMLNHVLETKEWKLNKTKYKSNMDYYTIVELQAMCMRVC